MAYRSVQVTQLADGVAEHKKRQVGIRFELRSLLKQRYRGRDTLFLSQS
jgi:hypothetical protein